MKHQEKYSTKRAVSTALRIILIGLSAFAVYALSTAEARTDWDVSFPMANAHVSWQQTFYGIPEVRP